MTHEAIARRTNRPIKLIRETIAALEDKDPASRTPTDDGRRIQRLDDHRYWGWLIINYDKFRDLASDIQRREKTAARVRKFRAKVRGVPASGDDVTPCNDEQRKKRQGEGEGEATATTERARAELVLILKTFHQRYSGPALKPGEIETHLKPLQARKIPTQTILDAINDETRDPSMYPRQFAKEMMASYAKENGKPMPRKKPPEPTEEERKAAADLLRSSLENR
jgi:hypothetical protein